MCSPHSTSLTQEVTSCCPPSTRLLAELPQLLPPSLRMKIKSPKRFRKKEKGDTSTAEANTSARRSKVISLKKLGKKALKGFRIKRKDKSAQQPQPSSPPRIALEHSDAPPIVEPNRALQETSKNTSIRQPELEDISKVASILKKTDDIVDTKPEPKVFTRATTPPRPSYRTMVGSNGPPTRSELNSRQASFKRMSGGGRQSSFRRRSSRRNIMKDAPPVDDPKVLENYERIPGLEITKLPRGGLSVETEAVGRVQFGIPPETIKDSMCMGIDVPLFYIVPVERFCREMGPALGVNLAEFEFPAYFNFFIQKKRCTLIVDSDDAERNIRRVFGETLLGPAQFRREESPISFEEEDFAPDFDRDAIPDFQKELQHFRVGPDGKELVIETLLNFCHFERPSDNRGHANLGVPPTEIDDSILEATEDVKADDEGLDEKKVKASIYSRVRLCEVAVLYNPKATEEEIASKKVKRVEIFKMPGGAEYVIHDINEDNVIVGKSRFSGNLRVSASLGVHGFGATNEEEKDKGIVLMRRTSTDTISRNICPPTFHPPSFGVTVLGNSHGFDKSGSVSGYVLWINGRGVMIDPPPYSSATLEREGIRPRTIVGIILTHCHADHDAGAFQKVLTGSPVVVITTPTIYKSFIRKYAALSALSPALLRHSHRHKPAIIGKPLRFQGATFHFTYTLHSIPCVGFRVEWRGRSIIFTGDHLNSPDMIEHLQDNGTLSRARAQDLKNLPLQDADVLLHEAGVPPLHTPLDVLSKLPKKIRDRLYVVHTTPKLLEGYDLKVAPTGTAGTIRLDEKDQSSGGKRRTGRVPPTLLEGMSYEEEVMIQSLWMSNEYDSFNNRSSLQNSLIPVNLDPNAGNDDEGSLLQRFSISGNGNREIPKVALRPTSSTDAWFILNLLSAVPFLSGLSYASTMEVLETARVDAYSVNDVVVPAARRKDVLCVVWEGTCMEKQTTAASDEEGDEDNFGVTVWHAGDWTGPISLQPEKALSGENSFSTTHDIVAMSSQGVKVITVEFSNLHSILKSGSSLYRAYLDRNAQKDSGSRDCLRDAPNAAMYESVVKNIDIMDVIETNSTLRKISAVQKRHLESLAEGPVYFGPGELLWRTGTPVEKAYILVGGTVSFRAKRRNASVGVSVKKCGNRIELDDEGSLGGNQIGEIMFKDAEKVRLEDHKKGEGSESSESSSISSHNVEEEDILEPHNGEDIFNNQDFLILSQGLQERAERLAGGNLPMSIQTNGMERRLSDSEFSDSISGVEDNDFDGRSQGSERRRSSIDRLANKQLVRLYNRRAFTAGLVFSRGHFLGDISKMVAGLLSSNYVDSAYYDDDDLSTQYGFGEKNEGSKETRQFVEMNAIHEQEGDQPIVHTSTLAAGKDGCVALVFSKSSLIPLFDEHPGLLLSLLGTQVVL